MSLAHENVSEAIVPILLLAKCPGCGSSLETIKWLPIRNWEKYIENQFIKCQFCLKKITYEDIKFTQLEPKYYIRNNVLYLRLYNRSYAIISFEKIGDLNILLYNFPRFWKGNVRFSLPALTLPIIISLDRGSIRVSYDKELLKKLKGSLEIDRR